MANLAMQGHATRGSEVISLLEMLGGKNTAHFKGEKAGLAYYIEVDKSICCIDIEFEYHTEFYKITLEEFLKKYPYEIGSKVTYDGWNCTVIGMEWENNTDTILYTVKGIDFSKYVYVENLQSDKKEAMEKVKNTWAKWDLPDGYEFQDKDGNIINTSVIKLVKKQPQYPKTYEECCEVLGSDPSRIIVLSNRKDIIHEENKHCYEMYNLYQLLICRDAYWKIAGDWKEKRKEKAMHYVICSTLLGEVVKNTMPNCIANYLLDFPTAEMRDAFYENFKELIEQCKELL